MEQETKQCSKCREYKPLDKDNFGKDNSKKDGFYSYCRKCNSANVAEWRETPEGKKKSRLINRKYDRSPKGKRTRLKRILRKEILAELAAEQSERE